ncbi:hypothetical protein F5Y13DRAFT_150355 [Hypoxylon sp. FL1857]|nr:hypothetical protein F5Y13DRAFT_150355 [Hypoxylon sp. FL1857]
MGQLHLNPIEAARRANIDASVQKYMDDVDRAIGGPPSNDTSREDWDRYLDAFMNEKRRRDNEDEENSWPELAKAIQYVEGMKQQIQPVSSGSEEDSLLKTIGYTTPVKQECRRERRQATKKNPRERLRQEKQTEEGKQQQTILKDDRAGKERGIQTLADNPSSSSTNAAGDPVPTTIPPYLTYKSEGEPAKKRRRTGAEILESDLGKNWEPRVDLNGHRPARRAKISQ